MGSIPVIDKYFFSYFCLINITLPRMKTFKYVEIMCAKNLVLKNFLDFKTENNGKIFADAVDRARDSSQ